MVEVMLLIISKNNTNQNVVNEISYSYSWLQTVNHFRQYRFPFRLLRHSFGNSQSSRICNNKCTKIFLKFVVKSVIYGQIKFDILCFNVPSTIAIKQDRCIVRFDVLTAVSMKMAVFWVLAPWSLAEVYQHFRGPCCIHHQDDEDSFHSSPWWRRQQWPLKRWQNSTRLHGATTQKTAILGQMYDYHVFCVALCYFGASARITPT
jgi:hypothetical protein